MQPDPHHKNDNFYNFEIQLPSKSEYCIDWIQKDYPKKPLEAFSTEQWGLDEVLIWANPGGSETIVEGEPTGRPIDRSEIEHELSKIGLTLEEIAICYYQRALQAGYKGHKARDWNS